MLQNYLKTAWRNFMLNKVYAAINIIGLSIAIAASLLVLLYVRNEYAYDTHHPNHKNTYRIVQSLTWSGETTKINLTPNILSSVLKTNVPEVEEAARLFNVSMFAPPLVRSVGASGEKTISEPFLYYADPNIFKAFSFDFLHGAAANALIKPNSIVITKRAAERHFGTANVLGKTLTIGSRNLACTITGVVENPPEQSHLIIDMLLSWSSMRSADELSWSPSNYYTYVILRDGTQPADFTTKANAVVERFMPTEMKSAGYNARVDVERISDIYLRSEFPIDRMPRGSVKAVYILSLSGIFILLIACINYVNLATARSEKQAKSVGIRKTIGANFQHIAMQFFVEALVNVTLAVLVSILFIELAAPFVESVTEKAFVQSSLGSLPSLLMIGGVWLFAVLVSGAYPAFFLASFMPIDILRGIRLKGGRAALLRKGLVVLQFTASIVLIISTLMLQKQVEFLQSKPLGFSKDFVVYASVGDAKSQPLLRTLRTELESSGKATSVAAVSSIVGEVHGGYSFNSSDMTDGKSISVTAMYTDNDLTKLLSIDIAHGVGFAPTAPTDSTYQFLLNEAAIAKAGWTVEQAVGKEIEMNGRKGEIRGVMRDFHFLSLHQAITPMLIWRVAPEHEGMNYVMMKLPSGNVHERLQAVEQVWRRVLPHRPFEVQFLDQTLGKLYTSERKLSSTISLMAALAIVIACLGLFALAAFAAEQRTKEIGIRKVLGASVASIIGLLSKDFLKLVGIAIVIATPLAYWAVRQWLQDYAYRIEISWWMFALAGTVALVIAFMTVAGQSWRAAKANPVKSLRLE